MRSYRANFGRYCRLIATMEDETYRFSLDLRGQAIGDYFTATLPTENELLTFFAQKVPMKMRNAVTPELRVLSGKIKESIKYLENASQKRKSNQQNTTN